MPDYKERYWGDKYDKLATIKEKYDPNNRFHCCNCVGTKNTNCYQLGSSFGFELWYSFYLGIIAYVITFIF